MNDNEKKLFVTLRNALLDAQKHLEYCGYGDKWKRECAEANHLEEVIETALVTTEGVV